MTGTPNRLYSYLELHRPPTDPFRSVTIHIGIDLGTSGCRAVAIDADGAVVAEQRQPLPPPQHPEDGFYQQNPQLWWESILSLLDQLIPTLPNAPIDSLCVDGTSATLLLCDRSGTPLTPALMYNDRRATVEADRISTIAPQQSGAHGATSSASKLLWILKNYPINNNNIFALHQADWISNRLADQFGWSDENNTLKMGYDPIQRCWPEWMETLQLPEKILPRVVQPGTTYGHLQESLLQRWNIDQDTPVKICAGTTDSIAATIACGISKPGEAVTSLGTTMVLKILSRKPVFEKASGIYSHRLGNQWLVSGASNAGAGVLLQYFTVEEIETLSRQIDPLSHTGLDYYPLPAVGERFPYADPTLSPRLTPRPAEDHQFLQGMFEGLSGIEATGYQKMEALGAPALKRVVTAGGGANNPHWTALRRQQLAVPIVTASHTEAAYGAALLCLSSS